MFFTTIFKTQRTTSQWLSGSDYMIKITILVVRTVIKTSLQQKLRWDPSGRRLEN